VVRRRTILTLALAAGLLMTVPGGAAAGSLPPLALQDQEGRTLSLGDLRGRAAVIVYGTRHAVEESITWGRRLQTEMNQARELQILAVAQMGGIPAAFHGVVRAHLRRRTPAAFSLWLDWDDALSATFGRHEALPTVVVADRRGEVQTVVAGRAQGASWDAVADVVRRLR
jgi:hypothetical protein